MACIAYRRSVLRLLAGRTTHMAGSPPQSSQHPGIGHFRSFGMGGRRKRPNNRAVDRPDLRASAGGYRARRIRAEWRLVESRMSVSPPHWAPGARRPLSCSDPRYVAPSCDPPVTGHLPGQRPGRSRHRRSCRARCRHRRLRACRRAARSGRRSVPGPGRIRLQRSGAA